MMLAILLGTICNLSACKPSFESWQVGEHWQYSPQAIWRDTFVGVEYIFGDGLEGQFISSYNLLAGEKERVLELDPAEFRVGPPSIYENRIVWSAANISGKQLREINWDKLNWDIFLLNLETGEVRQITNDEDAQIEPRVYDDTIVWLDNRHEEDEEYPYYYDVYAYDLKTGKERRITTTNSIREHDLGISGSLVVWTDSRNDEPSSRIDTQPPIRNRDIYLYDLSTNQERRITTDLDDDSSPVIDHGRIVWQRQSAVRNLDIFLYDVETGQEIQISKSGYAAHNYYPTIYGDHVVWADARLTRGNSSGDTFGVDESAGVAESGSAEIYLYDLGTKREILLVPSEGTEFTETLGQKEIKSTAWQVWLNPVIHGNFIVYTLARQVDPTIYVLRLDDE